MAITKSVAEHQEVPSEESAVKIIEVLEDRYGDRHLAVGRRREGYILWGPQTNHHYACGGKLLSEPSKAAH